MMVIRPYRDTDLEDVKHLHQVQGLDYVLPDVSGPQMLVSAVIEENGLLTHAAFLRQTAETYWLFDPKEGKRERLGKFLALHKEMTPPARKQGLEDIHCWIPPQVLTPKLHHTLLYLGWQKPLWTCYSRRVE